MSTALVVSLVFCATPKLIGYYDLTSHHVKLSTHQIIDEAQYGASSWRPGTQVLIDMGYELPVENSTTGAIPPLPYPMLWNMPLSDVYLASSTPLPLREFTPSVNAVATSSNPVEPACWNDSVTVIFSMDAYSPYFSGLLLLHNSDRNWCQLNSMICGTPSHKIPQR